MISAMNHVPRSLPLVLAIFSCGAVGLAQSDIACTATTPIEKQSRTELKHRNPATDSSGTPTTVKEMLTWKAPADVSSSAVLDSNSPIDPRETQVFVVTGDLRRIIVEDNDCDFHLELTSPGAPATADRVIVEIPQGPAFESTRQAILAKLSQEGVKFPARVMKKPIRVQVTGFAFYDAFHFSASDPQRGHDH